MKVKFNFTIGNRKELSNYIETIEANTLTEAFLKLEKTHDNAWIKDYEILEHNYRYLITDVDYDCEYDLPPHVDIIVEGLPCLVKSMKPLTHDELLDYAVDNIWFNVDMDGCVDDVAPYITNIEWEEL